MHSRSFVVGLARVSSMDFVLGLHGTALPQRRRTEPLRAGKASAQGTVVAVTVTRLDSRSTRQGHRWGSCHRRWRWWKAATHAMAIAKPAIDQDAAPSVRTLLHARTKWYTQTSTSHNAIPHRHRRDSQIQPLQCCSITQNPTTLKLRFPSARFSYPHASTPPALQLHVSHSFAHTRRHSVLSEHA